MRRMILTLILIMALAILTCSQATVHLGGSNYRMKSLSNLTNSSVNASLNATTSNIAIGTMLHLPPAADLNGTNGTIMMENVTNTSSIDGWGGHARPEPGQTGFDYYTYQIVHDNRDPYVK